MHNRTKFLETIPLVVVFMLGTALINNVDVKVKVALENNTHISSYKVEGSSNTSKDHNHHDGNHGAKELWEALAKKRELENKKKQLMKSLRLY